MNNINSATLFQDQSVDRDPDVELEIQKEVVSRMKEEIERKDASIEQLSRTLRVLDEQCERFLVCTPYTDKFQFLLFVGQFFS